MSEYNKLHKKITKEFVAAQQSYKDVIRNYHHYYKKYSGKRMSEVDEGDRAGVAKIAYTPGTLQRKSDEVKVILNWLAGCKYECYDLPVTNNKNVFRTCRRIFEQLNMVKEVIVVDGDNAERVIDSMMRSSYN